MKKVTYTNTMPYEFNADRRSSKYRLNGADTYKNRGETLESIAKWHRGLFTENNPCTSYCNGSDIEEENASVKSSEGSLGHSIGGHDNSASDKIRTYFQTVHSSLFIWIEWDEDTQLVTEYQMNKREFGAFVQQWTRICNNSEHTELAIRFRHTSKGMIRWLDDRCV